MKAWIKKILQFFLNPRFILCFGIGWMITNGWSYILMTIGTLLNIPWMMAVAGAYIAFLYLPSPEKIVTIAIAIFLMKRIFPNDKKTLGTLYDMKEKIEAKAKEIVSRKRDKKKNDKN